MGNGYKGRRYGLTYVNRITAIHHFTGIIVILDFDVVISFSQIVENVAALPSGTIVDTIKGSAGARSGIDGNFAIGKSTICDIILNDTGDDGRNILIDKIRFDSIGEACPRDVSITHLKFAR